MRRRIPYDRTGGIDASQPVGAPPLPEAGPPVPGGGQQLDLSQMMQPNPPTPGGLDQGGGMPDLSALLGGQGGQDPGMQDPGMMGGMGAGMGDEEGFVEDDQSIQDMMDALNNPDTPPEIRDAINAQIALAARRRLTGAGGGLQ